MQFTENTIECLQTNFAELVTSDPIITGLFDVMARQYDDPTKAPFAGNLHAFIDIKADEWLAEQWESYDDEPALNIKEKAELTRASLVDDLKEMIESEIEY